MDFNKMVMNSMEKMSNDGRIQSIVDKHMENTVESIVKETIGNYSSFREDLKKVVQESLAVNLKELDLKQYNHLILDMIRTKVEEEVESSGIHSVAAQVVHLLSDAKKEYKLSELIELLSEEAEDEIAELDFEESHEMSLHVEGDRDLCWVRFDAREDVPTYQCKYSLLMSQENQEILSLNVRERSYGKEDILKKGFTVASTSSPMTLLEDLLFKIYANNTKLILDEDSCETELYNPEFE